MALRGESDFMICLSSSFGATRACCFACCAASFASFAVFFSGFFVGDCWPLSEADCDLSAAEIDFFLVPPISIDSPNRASIRCASSSLSLDSINAFPLYGRPLAVPKGLNFHSISRESLHLSPQYRALHCAVESKQGEGLECVGSAIKSQLQVWS